MKAKSLILMAMTVLAGALFSENVNLSQYKWAVIGDSLSDPDWICDCGCKCGKFDHYYHYVAETTGIQVVYTNAVGSTGYMKELNQTYGKCFYRRLLERPLPHDVDVVTIMGSVNDNTLAPWDYSTGRVTDSLPATTNLAAYINKTIDVIRERAPKARIILCTGLYYYGTSQEKYQRCMDILRKIAAYRCIEFHDWLTPTDDDLDFSHIQDNLPAGSFAKQYAADWKKVETTTAGKAFGHPNALYHERWLAPKFAAVLEKALTDPDPIEPSSVNLSSYTWAVIGDKYSLSTSSPWPKYMDIVSEKTGIRIVYENAPNTDKVGYWESNKGNNPVFYQRIHASPVPEDVNLITLYGTIFDYNFDSTRYDSDPGNDVYPGNANDRLPAHSYAAYVNAAIDELVAQAPNAKIVMVGPLYHSGISAEKSSNINNTLAAVAEYRGIEYHDWLNGQAGDPLDYHQITNNQSFFEAYVNDRSGRTMGSGNWYGEPTASYHAQWIGPRMLSIVSNALVGTGAPAVAPELGSVRVIPWGTSGVFYSSLSKIGSGAKACDVYLAYGESADALCEPFRILDAKTGSFEYELKGLRKNTTYYYSLAVRNDAAASMASAAVTGSFTTIEEVRKDWSAKKWAVIGDSISDPSHPWGSTPVTKYYHYVARDTGIQVVYTNAYGSTGYEHRNSAHNVDGYYLRLKDEKWRIPSDVDVVTIFGAGNDCDKSNHIGASSDKFENGKSSYSAYVNGTIDLIREQAPNAQIIIVCGLWCYGINEERYAMINDAVRAVAEYQNVTYYNWTPEDPNDPLDYHQIADDPLAEDSFARKYCIDYELFAQGMQFGHPNDLYNEIWLSPHFRAILAAEFAKRLTWSDPRTRASTDFNGNVVSVSFSGDILTDAAVLAKLTVCGVDYAGVVGDGFATFAVPADAVTAGNVYDGLITLTVDDAEYTKPVSLVQGRIVVDEQADWIRESAAGLNATGRWSGDRIAVENGKVVVSNAVFTAAKPSPEKSVVTVATSFVFGGVNDDAFDGSALAGVKVVKVGKARRYAFLTGTGVETNLSVTANVRSAVAVTTRVDFAANTLGYTVGGSMFGPFPARSGVKRVSGVKVAGAADIASLDGEYRYEGVDANLAEVAGVEYATVSDAVAAGADAVRLLWDAMWNPSKGGEYIVMTNGFMLVIGGGLSYSVKGNGDGTVTVSVAGGSTAPSPTSITFAGGKVKIGVRDVEADRWYALEKTVDLAEGFVVVDGTWTFGADLLAGTSELVVDFGPDESQAFYRVVVSASERH